MQKIIFPLIITLFLIGSVYLFKGCEIHPVYGPFSDLKILGKIENWDYPVSVIKAGFISPWTSKFVEYASDTVEENGVFQIELVRDPADTLWYPMDTSGNSGCQTSFYISNEYGYAPLFLFLFSGNDLVGTVYKTNMHDTVITGTIELQYIFFNREVRIDGTRLCMGFQNDTVMAEYDINSKVLWNIISTEYLEVSQTMLHSNTVSVELPGAKWYCYYWGNDSQKKQNFLNRHKISLNQQ